jgi:hypothetical protein
MQGAQFENSILTGATFGKDRDGNWANLKVTHGACALHPALFQHHHHHHHHHQQQQQQQL